MRQSDNAGRALQLSAATPPSHFEPGRPTQDPLRPAGRRATFRRDVLGEAEPPARSQNAANLGEVSVGVTDAAQDQTGDDGIGGGIGQVDPFAHDLADLEIDAT